ncbi:site-2 protease family protein [Garciella nitratireducens]|uniref:Zn-dependent protease (Includes SpoIVFB) n=1 Tax=Garciella nitratireducens DSM 15102 TaxID=1121911 RepID=A0A1T4JUH7_9FIRM|nr:site-2 protease family protein [Garciella nitratireducens]SJZ33784.1 Zn-dependent protease (includes SpoIVFB) [Garciella nitratireducens DSM 15102]
MLFFNFIQIIYTIPPILIALTFHEFSHGFIAYKLGDPTAKEKGRLSLNPFRHLDPIGFLMLLFFKFGWAKPVPYNPYYFSNRKRGTFLVALAGPLSNLVLAFLSIIILFVLQPVNGIVSNFFQLLFLYNIIFFIFNLIPIPPLDGFKIIISLLPKTVENLFLKYERFGYLILLILIITDLLDKILLPMIHFVMEKLIFLANIFF